MKTVSSRRGLWAGLGVWHCAYRTGFGRDDQRDRHPDSPKHGGKCYRKWTRSCDSNIILEPQWRSIYKSLCMWNRKTIVCMKCVSCCVAYVVRVAYVSYLWSWVCFATGLASLTCFYVVCRISSREFISSGRVMLGGFGLEHILALELAPASAEFHHSTSTPTRARRRRRVFFWFKPLGGLASVA